MTQSPRTFQIFLERITDRVIELEDKDIMVLWQNINSVKFAADLDLLDTVVQCLRGLLIILDAEMRRDSMPLVYVGHT